MTRSDWVYVSRIAHLSVGVLPLHVQVAMGWINRAKREARS